MNLTKIISYLLLCGTLFSSSLYSASGVKDNINFVVRAEGVGATPDESRNNAFANLAQEISVSIAQDFASQEKEANGKYTHSVESSISSSSFGYFKGLSISSPFYVKVGKKKHYKTDVGLSLKAYKLTIDSILRELKINTDLALLSDDEIRAEISKAMFLRDIILFGGTKNISYRQDYVHKVGSYVTELNYMLSKAARVTFKVLPQNEDVEIILNDEVVQKNKRIFLPEGSFQYVATSKRYGKKYGSFNVAFGENLDVKVYFMTKLLTPVNIFVETQAESESLHFNHDAQQDIKSMLTPQLGNIGLNVVEGRAKSRLKVTFKKSITGNVAGMKIINTPLFILLRDGKGNTLVSKQINFSTTSENIDHQKVADAIFAEVEKSLLGNKILDFAKNSR